MGIEGPDAVPGREFNAMSRLAAIVESFALHCRGQAPNDAEITVLRHDG
jgi:hypothetical protein